MPKITSCQITAVDDDKKNGRYLISTKSVEGEWTNIFSLDIQEDVYHLKCMLEFTNVQGLQNIKKMEGKKMEQITNELEVLGHGNRKEYALLNECGKFTARQVMERVFY